jgi:NADPH:quinone reductase-like Zn-dependent oxidoreductase
MRVVEMTGPGIEAIRITTLPEPKVSRGRVKVRVKAASLNYRDLLIAKGFMPLTYPRIPLSDAVGEVVEVGEDVSRVAVGDRVCPVYYPDWISGGIAPEKFARDRGGAIDGIAADYLVLSEQELLKIPTFLTDAEAAAIPCAGVTAWSAVTRNVSLSPGSVVLIQGTGGVSLWALQFALAAGAETYLLSSSNEKLERARALGAHHTLNYRETPNWGAAIVELTGGRGVDLVVDVVGPGTLEHSVTAVTSGGRISQVGVLGGIGANLPILPLMVKEAHVDGIISGSRESAEAMLRAIEHHRLRPPIDRCYPLHELSDALTRLQSQAHFGKIAISFDDPKGARGA